MSKEDLFTAARRLARFLQIDLDSGGMLTIETEQALSILQQQVEVQNSRAKKTGVEFKCPGVLCPQPYLCRYRQTCSSDILHVEPDRPPEKAQAPGVREADKT